MLIRPFSSNFLLAQGPVGTAFPQALPAMPSDLPSPDAFTGVFAKAPGPPDGASEREVVMSPPYQRYDKALWHALKTGNFGLSNIQTVGGLFGYQLEGVFTSHVHPSPLGFTLFSGAMAFRQPSDGRPSFYVPINAVHRILALDRHSIYNTNPLWFPPEEGADLKCTLDDLDERRNAWVLNKRDTLLQNHLETFLSERKRARFYRFGSRPPVPGLSRLAQSLDATLVGPELHQKALGQGERRRPLSPREVTRVYADVGIEYVPLRDTTKNLAYFAVYHSVFDIGKEPPRFFTVYDLAIGQEVIFIHNLNDATKTPYVETARVGLKKIR